jgi:hypothetical protein
MPLFFCVLDKIEAQTREYFLAETKSPAHGRASE